MNKTLDNSQGQIFYGMHFYPGVAEYEDPNDGPFRVFINEDTIRAMGPSFAGRPIFVDHVNEVDEDIDTLRNEADGWVIESFFNAADGKTWAKFILVSDRALEAVKRGYKLSNAYIPKSFGQGGLWNGVQYSREVTDGEFEHLAIVQNPRYEESVIMTPEQFKSYNNKKTVELTKLSNAKGEPKMKFFKRTKVENSVDLESTMVELPKSKVEMSLTKLINDHDAILNMNGYANGDHMVKVGEKDEMSVNDLVKKHLEACNELESMKAKNDGDEKDMEDPAVDNDSESETEKDQMADVGDRGGDKYLSNEDDEEKDDNKKDKKDGLKNTMTVEQAKKVLAKDKALRLKNANLRDEDEEYAVVDLPTDQIARGKARYGSN
jgi:hypothetical protein